MKYSETELEMSYEKELLSKLLTGHLSIENKLDLMLHRLFKNEKYIKQANLRFQQKIDLILALELIPEKLGLYIKRLNSLRNKYAHRIDYELTFDDAFQLAIEGNQAGLYYSDMGIWCNKDYCKKNYAVNDIIFEIIYNTNFCLMNEMEKQGFDVWY